MEKKYVVPKATNIFDVKSNDSTSCVGCMVYCGYNEIEVHYNELKPKM